VSRDALLELEIETLVVSFQCSLSDIVLCHLDPIAVQISLKFREDMLPQQRIYKVEDGEAIVKLI
jgi:hypothetical protein